MSYELHIRRNPALGLAEWKQTVAATNYLRLSAYGPSARNPITGEQIVVGGVDGDVEIEIGGRWYPCFRWRSNGSAVFRPGADFKNPDNPVRHAATSLAEALGAEIVGDGGEKWL